MRRGRSRFGTDIRQYATLVVGAEAVGLTDEGLLLKEDIDFHRRYNYYLLYLDSDTATLRVAQNRGNEELLSFL